MNSYIGNEISNSEAPSDSTVEIPWIMWYCGLKGNEFLCEIDSDYIKDTFNLTDLSEEIYYYSRALDMILDNSVDFGTDIPLEAIEKSAKKLYDLIHARYILTSKGMNQMVKKYKLEHFGHCPRTYCEDQSALPIGLTEIYGKRTVKLYCPKCTDVFYPKSFKHRKLDGAAIGSGFPHMLFMMFPELRPEPPKKQFIAKMYGFKLHPIAYEYQSSSAKARSSQKY